MPLLPPGCCRREEEEEEEETSAEEDCKEDLFLMDKLYFFEKSGIDYKLRYARGWKLLYEPYLL